MFADEPFDPLVLADIADPYPLFARFRSRSGYAYGVPPYPELDGAVYLFTEELIQRALKHPDLLQSPRGVYEEIRESLVENSALGVLSRSVLFADSPRHAALRRPLSGMFSRRHIDTLEVWLQDLADDLIKRCLAADEFDLTRDFAMPFAIGALSRVTGLTIDNVTRLKQLTAELSQGLEIRSQSGSPTTQTAGQELRAIVEHCLANRARGDDPCLIDLMIDLVDSGHWSREDLISNSVMLMFAGQETVIDTIGCAAVTFDRHSDQKQLLSSRPDLLDSAVEELLRYQPVVHFTGARIAARDIQLGEINLRAGDAVVAVLAAGNRDPAAFADPDKLDITRPPAGHQSFGSGLHICLGLHLARLELKVVLRTLYQKHPRWRLAEKPPVPRRGILFRGFTSMPAIAA